MLQRLADGGNTVIVIEHNMDVIKSADWIIDLGPDGGDGGGEVVATGTPEEIAAHPDSYTGQYLAGVLSRARARSRSGSNGRTTRKPARRRAGTRRKRKPVTAS